MGGTPMYARSRVPSVSPLRMSGPLVKLSRTASTPCSAKSPRSSAMRTGAFAIAYTHPIRTGPASCAPPARPPPARPPPSPVRPMTLPQPGRIRLLASTFSLHSRERRPRRRHLLHRSSRPAVRPPPPCASFREHLVDLHEQGFEPVQGGAIQPAERIVFRVEQNPGGKEAVQTEAGHRLDAPNDAAGAAHLEGLDGGGPRTVDEVEVEVLGEEVLDLEPLAVRRRAGGARALLLERRRLLGTRLEPLPKRRPALRLCFRFRLGRRRSQGLGEWRGIEIGGRRVSFRPVGTRRG